jgi:hypothetical protein
MIVKARWIANLVLREEFGYGWRAHAQMKGVPLPQTLFDPLSSESTVSASTPRTLSLSVRKDRMKGRTCR